MLWPSPSVESLRIQEGNAVAGDNYITQNMLLLSPHRVYINKPLPLVYDRGRG